MKRGNNEGSVYRRNDGRWVATISLEGGRRKSFYGETRKEASAKLNTAMKARQDGLPMVGDRLTVGKYLEGWLEAIRPSLRPHTWRRYEQYVRIHAIPTIGRIPLSKLEPRHLERLYADRLIAGLSSTSTASLHTCLHTALSRAARQGLVVRNVATLVTRPRIPRHEMTTLRPEQARAFLEAATGQRLEALFVLALSTGMRQGELLALRWSDVDLDAATIAVRATLQRTRKGFEFTEPKTGRSRRQVALTKAAVEALRRHRASQLEERLRQPHWQNGELVFASEVGTPIEASNMLRRSFYPFLTQAGLPRIRFHDLRHTAATLMLGQGVHPKVASEMLGHSTIGVTLDLYSHVTPTMQRQAIEALDAVLGG